MLEPHAPTPPTHVLRAGGLLAVCATLAACTGDSTKSVDPSLIHTLERRDMWITVRDQGELQAARDTRVFCEVEGQSTVIYLIPEGTVVEQGERLVELDVSEVEEKRAGQAIAVAKARAAVEQARKNVEIMEKELLAAESTAETRLAIAGMQREKFRGQKRAAGERPVDGTNADMIDTLRELIEAEAVDRADLESSAGGDQATQGQPVAGTKKGPSVRSKLVDEVLGLMGTDNLQFEMGELANQVLEQIDVISLARADLELARDTLGHSRRLAAQEFITGSQLKKDEISYRRELSRLTVAWNNLTLLINYTLPETLITLQQEVANAELGLESVRGMNEARRVREKAELASAEAEYDLAKTQLENLDLQIRKSVIAAPAAGLVVYAAEGWRRRDTVELGSEVRERQALISLPDISTIVANLMIHEAQVDQVALGQAATIKVDAFPDRAYTGRVSMVSSLPDSRSRRSNSDLRVYAATVLLDHDNTDGTLRPGMNTTVEIDVGVLRDILSLPLPALQRAGDMHYVWLLTPNGPAVREIEVGGNNLTHIEVVAGLNEGDQVFLVEPPGVQPPAAPDVLEEPRERPGAGTAAHGMPDGDPADTTPRTETVDASVGGASGAGGSRNDSR